MLKPLTLINLNQIYRNWFDDIVSHIALDSSLSLAQSLSNQIQIWNLLL
jgi:hypothetical protein